MSVPTYRIVVAYDSQDRGYVPTATLFCNPGDGDPEYPLEASVDVRDYGTGDEVDEDGNLYRTRGEM